MRHGPNGPWLTLPARNKKQPSRGVRYSEPCGYDPEKLHGRRNSSRFATAAIARDRIALLLLLAINLFNYIDRYILASILPTVETAFLLNDDNAKTKIGLLTTGFLVSYMLLAPLFGWLGDRMSRWWLIAIGVILWSLASGASGVTSLLVGSAAVGYWVLLATRCFVGVGKAAYGPVAPTLISDLFAVRMRGQILAYFYAAIPVGSALGFFVGGVVGWPWAFYLVLPPGILLGVLCLFMREPVRGQADPRGRAPSHSQLARIRRPVQNSLLCPE